MLQQLIRFSVRFRGVVLSLSAALLLFGLYKAQHAKLDVFPDFVQPQASIQTEAPGLPPEQVETLVTRPIEGAINGVPHLESVRSQSVAGLSIVSVFFDEDTNIFLARELLSQQLAVVAGELPAGVKPPKLTPLTSATMDLLKIGLVSDTMSLMELRTFADWTLRPRLQAVQGIAQVGIMGGDVREFQVQVLPERLAACGLSLDDVLEAARRSTGVRGAGYVETANQRVVLQTESPTLSAEQLGETLISRGAGGSLRLADVARVCVASQPKFGDVLIQGRPGVLVKLLSQYGANTMDVTREVEEALEQMQGSFDAAGIEVFPRLHRPATFIETALHHVSRSLYYGALLVVVVLTLFLFNLRTAFISIVAIPLSLLTAVIVLDKFGLTLNTITLGGLAIAIGEVVDDAIIDVENIFRRLRENVVAGVRRSVADVVLGASIEVRGAVVYATLVVVLVFVPVLTLSGLQGRMFAPLGVAYIAAILASLVVALTVTPALSCLLLPSAAQKRPAEPWFIRALKGAYLAILRVLLRRPRTLLWGALTSTVAVFFVLNRFGHEFLPEFREGHFVVQISTVPGTSLPETMRFGQRVARDLFDHVRVNDQPVLATIEHQAGRAELGEDPWGPHRSELHIELEPEVSGKDQADVQAQIRDRLDQYPGLTYEVLTFLGDRISETISGETASVVINIFGDDLDQLDLKASQIAGVLDTVAGAADVHVASPPGMPAQIIRLRPQRLTDLGFRPLDVLTDIETAYQGVVVAQTVEADRVYDVRVILAEEARAQPETIGDLSLRSLDGRLVPLRLLADVTATNGRYMVLHEGARRRQTVLCNVEDRDVGSFVREARRRVAQISLPPGLYVEFSGEAQAAAAARNELMLHSGVAGLGIVLLLATVFAGIRKLMLVLMNLPFALIGGVLAVALTGWTLSIGSVIGFVTLFGITMRNSVMMISHFEHLVAQEGMPWGEAAVLRGASERLIPVLMTALVTGLGLLPIALGSGEVGREIEGPMAIVILGGLFSSTLLNLLLLPTFYLGFGQRRAAEPIQS
ncbi:MAG: efflux RND transporter permease subunit [Phycisphaerales bacterium]|nr:efflux RND transporter permease subunit [Phycisphaerales bacterium]